MKAFIIIPKNSLPKNSMFVSMISAFVSIETIGVAEDILEAVDIIRHSRPNTLIFTMRILEEKEHRYLASVLEAGDSFIMLPKYWEFKDRCIYIEIDFSAVGQKEWVLNVIGEALREYPQFIAH